MNGEKKQELVFILHTTKLPTCKRRNSFLRNETEIKSQPLKTQYVGLE
jgi:hypothetical protein